MKEKDFITIIKQITNSKYIGDDCAYLKEMGIVITQDSLVEGVHFSLDYITPEQLGYKSVMVNLSDIAASGSEPKYITVSLSMPACIESKFVEKLYTGMQKACRQYNPQVKIAGGDITGGDKVFISICAIGSAINRRISSRKNAKPGYKIIVSGNHGSSAAGLYLLLNGKNTPEKFIKSHLEPKAQIFFGEKIAKTIMQDYAMMDTSDGLMDALSAIAYESGVSVEVDFDKIPYDKDIKQFENWQDLILYGGEDYQLIAAVPQDFETSAAVIGKIKKGSGIDIITADKKIHLEKTDIENKLFNHFDTEKNI